MSNSSDTVRETAQDIRHEYFESDYSWDGLENILDALGGRIEYVSGDDLEETLLIDGSDGTFTIYLPRTTSEVRDFFTIAHELGHYFLHWDDDGEDTVFSRCGSNWREWEANSFAAELLMPEERFIEVAEDYDYDVSDIADHFGVSRAAVNVRMDVLNLV